MPSTQYTVRIFPTAIVDVPAPEVFWMERFADWTSLRFIIAVIEGGGKTIVLNTGFPGDIAPLAKAWSDFLGPRAQLERPDDWRPEIALPAAGIDPAKVNYVLISPIQLYATGNLQLFSNAKLCFSKRGWVEDLIAHDYRHHVPRQGCISDDDFFWLLGPGNDRLMLLEDEHELLPGLRCKWVGAHHRSSFAVEVETARGTVILSDAAFHLENLEKDIPIGIAESIIEAHHAYAYFRRRADIFVPLYDPLNARRFPGGVVA
jgi:hypothetical protein